MSDLSIFEGWNPSYAFEPKNDLSKELLRSIPRKVNAWLENLKQPITGPGELGPLRWNFGPDSGSIIYEDVDGMESYAQIIWHGPVNNIETIYGSDERFEDLTQDLSFFTTLEKNIYDELEKLQRSLVRLPSIDVQKYAKKVATDRGHEA
jgi:hypothetical protein